MNELDPESETESDTMTYRTRFEQSAMPQVACDLAGRLENVNAAFCRLLDRSRDDLIGRYVEELSHPSETGEGDAVLGDLLGQRTESARFERVLRGPQGRPLPVLVDADLLRTASGVPFGVAAFVQDLRRLKDVERRHQQQEDFFLALSQRATDLAIVADADGRMLYISPAVTSVLGYTAAEELLRTGWEFIHPDDIPGVHEIYEAVICDRRTRTTTMRVRAADGSWRHVEETITHMLDTPVGGLVCNLRDVTEQVEARQALAASEARYRAIVENADEGIWVASRQGLTTFVNARMLEILGLDAQVVYARTPLELMGVAAVRTVVRGLRERHERGAERHEIDYHHPDGDVRHLSVSATPLRDDAGFEGSLALVSDITSTRSATRRLQHAANHDDLTGLPNRSQLQRGVSEALAHSPDSTAVLFVDLDHFKVVNDARGHGAGDDLLRAVSERLRSTVRPGDLVARFGGDEFVVVCQGVSASDAQVVARRVLDVLEGSAGPFDGHLPAPASIGIALSPAISAEELLREADAAMYAAKAAGRRTIRFFDASLASTAQVRYQLSNDLRAALDDRQLDLAYQPIVSLRSGAVQGAEGLARWRHPQVGAVPPSRFVPVALETGLAAELDFCSIRRAASDLATFRRAGVVEPGRYAAVNLSARTLDHPSLISELTRAVVDNGLEPADLVLEVTEASVVTRAGEGARTLRSLAAIGHIVAIDDFGTGHSALSYLQDLPAGMLKIDRSFVRDLAVSAEARAIIAAIIGLAHGLGMQVVAEGVEDRTQADILRDLGCDGGQGWFWAVAVSAEEVLRTGVLARGY